MASVVHPPKISSISGYRLQSPAKNSPNFGHFYETPTNVSYSAANVQKVRLSKSRIKICAKIKEVEESRVLKLGNDIKFYGQFSATPVKESREEKEKRNYYVNTGTAIRTLREEFPELFYRELSFHIYRFHYLYLLYIQFCWFMKCEISVF